MLNVNYEKCLELIDKAKDVFEMYYNQQRHLACKYYTNVFKNEKSRILVFDIGYSGGVSLALSNYTDKTVDKIFIYETPKNIFYDNKNQSYTFILKNGITSNSYKNFYILLEECFSPLTGTCTGFKEENENIFPLFEKINFPLNMKKSIEEINLNAEKFTQNLKDLFGDYLQYLNVTDMNEIIECVNENFKDNVEQKEIFKDIVYKDSAILHKQLSLKDKLL